MNVVVIDTEATPIVPMSDKVDARKMRVYDVGYIVRDKRSGEVLTSKSFLVTNWYYDGRHYMDSAYYAEKLPQYNAGIATGGEWTPADLLTVWKSFSNDCKTYNVREVWAYNARFDMNVLNVSIADASNGFVTSFVSDGIVWRDIWTLAQCITGTARYNQWAYSRGLFSVAGIAKTGVEPLISYITDNENFTERHTALDDAQNESDILTICLSRKSRQPETLGGGYRAAMAYAKTCGHYIPKDKR